MGKGDSYVWAMGEALRSAGVPMAELIAQQLRPSLYLYGKAVTEDGDFPDNCRLFYRKDGVLTEYRGAVAVAPPKTMYPDRYNYMSVCYGDPFPDNVKETMVYFEHNAGAFVVDENGELINNAEFMYIERFRLINERWKLTAYGKAFRSEISPMMWHNYDIEYPDHVEHGGDMIPLETGCVGIWYNGLLLPDTRDAWDGEPTYALILDRAPDQTEMTDGRYALYLMPSLPTAADGTITGAEGETAQLWVNATRETDGVWSLENEAAELPAVDLASVIWTSHSITDGATGETVFATYTPKPVYE